MEYGQIKSPLWEMHFVSHLAPKGNSRSEFEKRALEAFLDIQKSYEALPNPNCNEISSRDIDDSLKSVVDTLKNFSELMEEFDELTLDDEKNPPTDPEND